MSKGRNSQEVKETKIQFLSSPSFKITTMSVERNKEEKFLGVKMSLTMCHIQFLRVILSVIYCNSGDLNE